MKTNERRKFIKQLGLTTTGAATFGPATFLSSCGPNKSATEEVTEVITEVIKESDFKISLAQWSLHKSFFGASREKGWEYFGKMLREDPDALLQGSIKPVDFPRIAAETYKVDAIELVNTFYFSKSKDSKFWAQYKEQCDEVGVKALLIMCDALGDLGNSDEAARIMAVENHYPWVDIAKSLGCHSIRVNAAGQGTAEEVAANAIDGLRRLTKYGKDNGINIIVENHGGYSSDGQWLSGVISGVGSDYCGTLPDFGNFCMERSEDGCAKEYDRYKGMKELMPFAKGVSGKAHEFDAEGNEIHSDFVKMMQIVKDSGYKGYVDIEYEGNDLSEEEGIKATKELLERAFEAVA